MNGENDMNSLLTAKYTGIVTIATLALMLTCVAIIFYYRTNINKLKHSAYDDTITGSLSEAGFYVKLQKTIGSKVGSFAFVSMQIKDLSQIVKTFNTDDRIRTLNYISDVLSAQLGNEEFVSRTGEDTFLFALKLRDHDKICVKLNLICDALNRFNSSRSSVYSLNPVFGIYLAADGETISDIENKAILARINAEAENMFCFYDIMLREKTDKLRETASSMESALNKHEFVVYYQPVVRVSDRRVVGAEALIRWRHPLKGVLSPDMFLPLAEQYRLIENMDRLVFEDVCTSISMRNKKDLEPCPVSVNLSRASLNNADLPKELYDICCRMNVSPSLIEFEAKEHLLLENIEKSKSFIEKLHLYGFRCAIDNFGASSCSLQLLTSLDIDTLKLDKSFFSGGNNKNNGRRIIETILKLAAQLHIRTVAEGIDNVGQVQYLQQAACDAIQGFYYFKPMNLDRFEDKIYDDKALAYADNPSEGFEEQTQKKSVERQSLEPAKNIVLFSYNPEEDTIDFSDIFSPVLGNKKYFEDALALFRTTDLIHENDRKDFLRTLERCQREDGWIENTLRFYTSEGRYQWFELKLHQEDHVGGAISGTMANMSAYESEVNRWKEKATRDALTGLYNREFFEQNVSAAISKGTYPKAAVLFIDVDNFKTVNDTYGHIFGDNVLCYMAKQLMGIFRHTDIIARYGGDEFVVFAPSIEKEVLESRLNKLYSTFKYPYRSDNTEYNLASSIGAAMYPTDGMDYETLLDHADCALYEAKERGKNCYVLYEPYMHGEETDNSEPQTAEE